jgi:mercuric ion transport protein
MKALVASVVAATAASVCCIGPVVAAVLGAGALGAASTRFEPYRPWFLGLTMILLGVGFWSAYRREPECADDTCALPSRRSAKIVLWISVVLISLLAGFPYYMKWFV